MNLVNLPSHINSKTPLEVNKTGSTSRVYYHLSASESESNYRKMTGAEIMGLVLNFWDALHCRTGNKRMIKICQIHSTQCCKQSKIMQRMQRNDIIMTQ